MNDWTQTFRSWFVYLRRCVLRALPGLRSLFNDFVLIPIGTAWRHINEIDPKKQGQIGAYDYAKQWTLPSIIVLLALYAFIRVIIPFFDAMQWTALLTLVLACFTAQQALYARRQWQAMSDQNAIMVEQNIAIKGQLEQMRLEQRAWLSVPDQNFDDIEVNKPLCSKVILLNSGHTPGFINRGGFIIRVLKPGDDIDTLADQLYEQARSLTASMAIPPGGQFTCVQDSGEILTPELNGRMIQGPPCLLLVGVLQYTGVATKDHETAACYVYAKQHFRIHGKYNYMT